MRLKYNSRLTIAKMPPFPYDGRGNDSIGIITDNSDGTSRLFFPASATGAPPLPMVPGRPKLPLRVEILPQDLVGTIDFCSGQVAMNFDAKFQPNAFGYKSSPMSVVTDLTTASSKGGFQEVKGRPLDAKGDLRLVGVARVPKTENFFVNRFLSLPTDAVTEMEAHFDFPDGRFACPGRAEDPTPVRAFFDVEKDGRLTISNLPPFPYDGKGSGGYGSVKTMPDGRLRVRFAGDDLSIPPLPVSPGSQFARIEIKTRELTGEINPATGEIFLSFDSSFTPMVGKLKQTPISVVTKLTTEVSKGNKMELKGKRMDAFGDAFLVGVAVVPRTKNPYINGLLKLPTDAACELPVHFDFLKQ